MCLTSIPPNYESRRADYLREREFLETLMNSRFNFLLVVYGIVIAGAVSADSARVASFVLLVGVVVCGALAVATFRAYTVALPIIALLKQDPSTPLAWASAHADASHRLSRTANAWIGSRIPGFCVVTLMGALVALHLGYWEASEERVSPCERLVTSHRYVLDYGRQYAYPQAADFIASLGGSAGESQQSRKDPPCPSPGSRY